MAAAERNCMKFIWKRPAALALALAMLLPLAACGGKKDSEETKTSVSVTEAGGAELSAAEENKETTAPAETSKAEKSTEAPEEMRSFVDSVGRTVKIPVQLDKVAPSGPLAQVVLYTAFPDRLCGLTKQFTKSQLPYFPERYHNLPEFGQFYGKKSNLNKEALLAADPDVIIDIGEPKKTVKEDMDKLQEQLNIPTIFIEAKLPDMASAYRKLGELFGETTMTDMQADYCEKAISFAEDIRSKLKDEDKVKVYWAMGDKGLNTNAAESFQSEVLQIVGADNVAKVDPVSRGGGSEVSFEQLLEWKPDYILVDNEKLAETIQNDATWQEYIKSTGAELIVVPNEPYGVLADPPSVNRILGIYWLGQKLYPDLYQRDLVTDFAEFYDIFYHSMLTDKQLRKLLG